MQHNYKTKTKIKQLIDNNDVEALRNLSQHCIQNSMYNLRFGMHSDQGIHGTCPMEMLHAILLGMFRYIRDGFFEQIGPSSKLSDTINAWARKYGSLISRQSERDFPKTSFSNGILKGKLNAKDFPGILLCMSVCLRCKEVRDILEKKKASVHKSKID